MYFCYGYCISVYLDWFPTYLKDHRGFSLKQMGFYASLPLLAGTAGDLLGGWLSDWILRKTRQHRVCAAQRGHRRVPAGGRGNYTRHAHARSGHLCLVQLPGRLRAGVDRGCFLGAAARHRGRLRRFGVGADEHVR